MEYPEDFSAASIDLEIDFETQGGVQRFKTVGDFQAWLSEEQEFWSWLSRPPANQQSQQLGNFVPQFQQYHGNCNDQLEQQTQQWNRVFPRITELREQAKSADLPEEEREAIRSQVEHHESELNSLLDQLRSQLGSILKREIIQGKYHITRMEPQAQFIHELAEDVPEEAIYALDQIVLDGQNSGESRQVGFNGRLMAALHLKNLNRKLRPDQRAFEKAIVTWGKELADFKARYEAQEEEFRQTGERHSAADDAWRQRADEMSVNFAAMRKSAEDELKNLKDTYDSFMQLEAPLTYWKEKREEHAKGKKVMAAASAIGGALGVGALVVAASYLLPESHPADTIPWRQIGFFFLASTFVLWLIRLLVKLMLSHIHLYADAREREVMISTFLALIHRQESREGIKKTDLALVLAPIFRPSTTGVIKEDGGPSSFADFISRLAGKP